MNRLWIPLVAVVFIAAIFLGSALFTVRQTEQVLLTQFGEPIRVIDIPGLHAKLPFVQTAITFDKRLLDYDMPAEEVILSEQRRLIVDAFARYRISDPLRYYQTVGATEEAIRGRLQSIVSSSLRRVLGNQTLLAVLSSDRGHIMMLIRNQVNVEMKGFGVTIADVRIRRADLPEENTQAILARMQSERQRIAKQVRAEGAETAARIRADADRDRTVLLAEARAKADKLRGQGEEQAIRTYADAYQKDPHFFAIWRTLQAYRQGFGAGHSRLLLTEDNDFLRLLQGPPGSDGTAPAASR